MLEVEDVGVEVVVDGAGVGGFGVFWGCACVVVEVVGAVCEGKTINLMLQH